MTLANKTERKLINQKQKTKRGIVSNDHLEVIFLGLFDIYS